MPQLWVTKEFADAVTEAGYDPQKYVTALLSKQHETKNVFKPALTPVELQSCKSEKPGVPVRYQKV